MTLYIDQQIEVFGHTEKPELGPIRVHFSDVTLSMSLIDASWLAENIQREIRKFEREHPELCVPSDEARRNLKVGDVVTVRDDDGRETDYEVKWEPWALGSGQMVVGLKGLTYGYALDRVVKIVQFAEQPQRSIYP
jgi:hypothetical protein